MQKEMTQVDFYILPEDNSLSPLLYAARLIEKAFRRGHRIYVHTGNAADTQALSDQLWQRDGAFLAHGAATQSGASAPALPVLVSHLGQASGHTDVLVNLAGTIPTFCGDFQRIAEIVPGKPESRSQSRENFRLYREKGYSLKTHNIQP